MNQHLVSLLCAVGLFFGMSQTRPGQARPTTEAGPELANYRTNE